MDNTYVYVAGASSRACTTKEYLESLFPNLKVKAFLVSPEMNDNPEEVCGIPVLKVAGNGPNDYGIDTGLRVYISTRGVNHGKLTMELLAAGFLKELVIPVTPELDIKLRNQYMKMMFSQQGRGFVKVDELISKETVSENKNNVRVYVAKSAVDHPLGQDVPLMEYERIIQVGRALADRDIAGCDVFDDTGENISLRNRQFSELTGLYWLWKNAKDDVIGLEHYRRRFTLPDGWQTLFEENECDVILPVPLYVAPNLQDNYLFRHDHRPWEAMMQLVKTDQAMYDAAVGFFSSNGCFSPCNMMIVRREVLEDLCFWLFPILLGAADEVGTLDDSYQNRYCGFLSERMISFFFYYNRDRYKVVYADKSFLG